MAGGAAGPLGPISFGVPAGLASGEGTSFAATGSLGSGTGVCASAGGVLGSGAVASLGATGVLAAGAGVTLTDAGVLGATDTMSRDVAGNGWAPVPGSAPKRRCSRQARTTPAERGRSSLTAAASPINSISRTESPHGYSTQVLTPAAVRSFASGPAPIRAVALPRSTTVRPRSVALARARLGMRRSPMPARTLRTSRWSAPRSSNPQSTSIASCVWSRSASTHMRRPATATHPPGT